MRIVFLDIDGVLVTRRSFFIRQGDLPSCEPSCVQALNWICEAADAQIVVTSSWRLESSLEELCGIFQRWGVKASVLDVTPIGVESRGAEIDSWMPARARAGEAVASYVIVDDCQDVSDEHLARLVVTDTDAGLCEADADRAIELLRSRG